MKLLPAHASPRAFLALIVSVGIVAAAEGCGSSSAGSDPAGQDNGTSSSGSGSSSGTGSSGASSSGGSSSNSGPSSSGTSSSGNNPSPGDEASQDASSPLRTNDAGETIAPDGAVNPPSVCMKGMVTPNQVVMIGDSYLDPAYGNVGPNIIADAQMAGALPAGMSYRKYYVGGAAMNNGALTLNIPYQYDTSAKGDIAVANPKDIKVVVMDGGGNDVLIDQRSCLTDATSAAQMADMPCMTAVANTVARTSSLWKEMAADGVKQIVYFFYPHLDPGGGGLLTTPAPGVNLVDDYSAPLYQKVCCGSSFTPTATNYTCTGNAPGTQCTFVDTRPAFTGHSGAVGEPGPDWIQADHVHPDPAGSTALASLVWDTMVAKCVAQ